MENNSSSYLERSKEEEFSSHKEGVAAHAAESVKEEIEREKKFSPETWSVFEASLRSLGFSKKETEPYLTNVATLHGQEVFVRRASMYKVFDSLENGNGIDINPLDTEPNAVLLGKDVAGIEAALSSGFGWLVNGKIASVFGFIPEHSPLSIDMIDSESVTHHKKDGDLMRRVSGKLLPEDVLFMLFRIHKSAFPEQMLEDEDMDGMEDANPFIFRLYAKNRQAQ